MHGLLLGMKPTKIEIMPFGLSISFKLKPEDYNKKILKANVLEIKKIIVATMGPITNIMIAIGIAILDPKFISKDSAIYANILIAMFNLLPIYPLDGGRVLKSIVHIFGGGKVSKIVTNKVANITMIISTFIGSIGIYYYKNISIFFIIIFLWWIAICENKKYKIIIKVYDTM